MANPPNPPSIQVDKNRLKKKDTALLELLSTHHEVVVHLDTRVHGVVVPKHLQGRPQLVLLLGLNLRIPVRDLKVGDTGFTAVLSFERAPFKVVVPWNAVFLIVGVETGIGTGDPSCTPPEAKVLPATEKPPAKSDTQATKRKTIPPFLRVIEGGKDKSDAPGPHKPPTAS